MPGEKSCKKTTTRYPSRFFLNAAGSPQVTPFSGHLEIHALIHPADNATGSPLTFANGMGTKIKSLLENSVMLVTTSENIAGFRIVETKGQVFGVVVRSRGVAGNIMAGLRSIVGGEIKEYTQMLEEARRHAVDRMVKNAQVMGANAVIMMRFDSSEMGQTMSEVVAYGTAVTAEAAG